MDFSRFSYLTFDCYGTLIDWESGIYNALHPLLKGHGIDLEREELLEKYGEIEPKAEAGPFKNYKAVLRQVTVLFGQHYGFTPTEADLSALAASLRHWPPFADTVAALQRLAGPYRLVILSNIDRDLIAASTAQLGVDFHAVVTAEDVQSYKPAAPHFDHALELLGGDATKILHVAQSLYHDIAPAKALGWTTCWVNRRRGQAGAGATPVAHAVPDLEVGTLGELAAMI